MAECGAVLRILGELPAAERAFERAAGYGYEGQPGRSLLWLSQGRAAAATAAVQRILAEPQDAVHRSQILPGAVEVLVGAGEAERALTLAEELGQIAESFGCAALRAMADHALGSAYLATGDAGAALPVLRRAAEAWRVLDAPYDVGRARQLIGLALRALGDDETAVSELEAARTTFRALGAKAAEREADALLGSGNPGGLTDREMEVLRLVATGSSNPEIAAALVLSEKTVARHLSNIFTKLDVRSRTAAAAFAFEHRLV
jgi:DNA-binding NarL/FixJ family response regulator